MIIEVKCYKTADGKLFESEHTAYYHEESLSDLEKANSCFEAGVSIGDSLKAGGWKYDIDPVLFKITNKTKLVISHW